MEAIPPKKIVVFLPPEAAKMIVAKLAERGHDSVAVSTVPEVFGALRSDNCSFAITTRPEIDLVRSIRPIPVVNLEIFFHAGASGDGPLTTSKRFDVVAFMKRIEFLAQPKAARVEPGGEQIGKDGVRQPKRFQWAAVIMNLLIGRAV